MKLIDAEEYVKYFEFRHIPVTVSKHSKVSGALWVDGETSPVFLRTPEAAAAFLDGYDYAVALAQCNP